MQHVGFSIPQVWGGAAEQPCADDPGTGAPLPARLAGRGSARSAPFFSDPPALSRLLIAALSCASCKPLRVAVAGLNRALMEQTTGLPRQRVRDGGNQPQQKRNMVVWSLGPEITNASRAIRDCSGAQKRLWTFRSTLAIPTPD
jgi:hypothetical protein